MSKNKVISIRIKDATDLVSGEVTEFPKYTTQIINLANQNSGGTRPNVVGQLSDLIQECPFNGYVEWGEWYIDRHPNAIDDAVDKIMPMVDNLREAIELINEDMVRSWVEDLVVTKTYVGLKVQEVILKVISDRKDTSYRLAEPLEESKGIDGYIGDIPVSIKPLSYKTKNTLREDIKVGMIFYEKTSSNFKIYIDEI